MNDDEHIIPRNDINPHIETECPCKPTIKVVGADLLIIHNAWDNREVFEQAIVSMIPMLFGK